jgi:hypothetical protein
MKYMKYKEKYIQLKENIYVENWNNNYILLIIYNIINNAKKFYN